MENERFKPLAGDSVTEKTVNSEIVMNVIEEQYCNLFQRRSDDKNFPYQSATEVIKNFVREVCRMAMIDSKAPTLIQNWKKDYANETIGSLRTQGIDAFVKKTIKEMREKFRKDITPSDLINYSFFKIANHAGLVSRMILHGYHPDLLLLTIDEANEALLKKAKLFQNTGIPTIVAIHHTND